jgi:hypothetical protein
LNHEQVGVLYDVDFLDEAWECRRNAFRRDAVGAGEDFVFGRPLILLMKSDVSMKALSSVWK